MGRGGQDGHSGHYSEQGEYNEAETVQHHGRKLPVILDGRALLVIPDLVRDDLDLLQDQTQLSAIKS